MSSRTATRLAWGAWAASVVLTSAALAFVLLNHSNSDEGTIGSQVGNAFFLVALLTFSTVGALVASRRPENPIGWIFLSLGAMFAISAFADGYATYALVAEPGALPAGMAMAWVQSWLFLAPLILSGTLVFLLFPNGRLLSRRWLPVLWAAAGGIVLALLAEMFLPGPLEGFESIENPYAVAGAAADALEIVANVAFVLMLASLIASAISLILRFRRSTGLERQQLKWVASAAGLVAVAWASGPLVFWWIDDGPWEPVLLLCSRHHPHRGRARHPPLPPLRARPYRQPRGRLRRGLCAPRRRVLRDRARAPGGVLVLRRRLRPGHRRLHARRRRALPARCGPESSGRSTGASTAAATTRRGRSRRSRPASATRSTSRALQGELTAVVGRTLEPAQVSLWLREPKEQR